jgi:predicted Zn-dependent protease
MLNLIYILFFVISLFIFNCAQAFQLVVDEEAEEVITKIAKPIFQAAGLPSNELKIRLIHDDSINAFVGDNKNVFIFTGLLTFSENPEVLAGVLAHECAHMALGHISLTRERAESLQKGIIATTLLGAAAGLISGNPILTGAIIMGATHSAQLNFLSHSRTQESQADAVALKYLSKINISSDGLIDLLKYLNSHERVFFKGKDPYLLSHPISKERISYIKKHPITLTSSFSHSFQENYALLVAKIYAFTQPPTKTLKKYKGSSKKDFYAQSIAYYKKGDINKAIMLIDMLLKNEPANFNFLELKAQFLFENGKVIQAIEYYEKAMKYNPKSFIFKIELASALTAANKNFDQAIALFRSAIDNDRDNFMAWHGLGICLRKKGKINYSYVALARALYIAGDKATARKFINSVENEAKEVQDKFYKDILEETKAMLAD